MTKGGVDLELAAVVGFPVSHSLSPAIFAVLARELEHPLVYRRVEVAGERLRALFTASREARLFRGWNVTIPHKEAMAKLVDRASPEARAIGAVNVVHFADRGGTAEVIGHNTDWIGVLATLEEEKCDLRGKAVVLYGAGGAARAVVFALAKAGAATVYVVNRSVSRARGLAREIGRQFPRTRFVPVSSANHLEEDREGREIALLVNATPVGMKQFPGRFRFPHSIAPGALAFDLIYRPSRPVFLRQAERLGLRTVNGLDMLLWQAIATWEIWFGRIDPKRRARLKARLKTATLKAL